LRASRGIIIAFLSPLRKYQTSLSPQKLPTGRDGEAHNTPHH
jgi:hypothetical protein